MTRQNLDSKCIHKMNVEWRNTRPNSSLQGLQLNCYNMCNGKASCNGYISIRDVLIGRCAHKIKVKKLMESNSPVSEDRKYCMNGCKADSKDHCDSYMSILELLESEDALYKNLFEEREITRFITYVRSTY